MSEDDTMFSLVCRAIMRPEKVKAMCNFFQTYSETPQNDLLIHISPNIYEKLRKKKLSSAV